MQQVVGAATPAPRNIVLLSDGTGNSAASLFHSNVRRFHDALDVADPANPALPRQFVFYDDGVGTGGVAVLRALGGAFGFGLARNVRDLYASLCRVYRPGDRIYALGFSRGAFTVRMLAGMVVNLGLVPHDGCEARLQRRVNDAFRAYRAERFDRPWSLANAGRRLRDLPLRALRGLARDGAPDFAALRRDGQLARPDIHFLGAWDTVDAYGLPVDELTRLMDRFIWPVHFKDADLDERVLAARQALSLDDERLTFHPRLWNEAARRDPASIRQVWFTGVHADVGGGYPDGGLSHVALDWMVGEAEKAGLRFVGLIREQQRALSDAQGPLHDSRRGLHSFYRYKPRDVAALSRQPGGSAYRPAVHVARPLIHRSVFDRIRVGQDGHMPLSLPLDFDVVGVAPGQPAGVQDGATFLGLAPAGRRGLQEGKEGVRDLIWLGRLLHFVVLSATLVLAVGALAGSDDVGLGRSWEFLTPLLLIPKAFLPGVVAGPYEVLAANVPFALVLGGIAGLGYALARTVRARTADRTRWTWYAHVPDWAPPGLRLGPPPPGLGPLEWLARKARTCAPLGRAWRFASWRLAPVAVAGTALVLALAAVNALAVSAEDSLGYRCAPSEDGTRPPGYAEGGIFRTATTCHRVAAPDAARGATFRLRLLVPSGAERSPDRCEARRPDQPGWCDRSLPANPRGLERWPAYMALLTPFRRHATEPWFRVMVRVGEWGLTVHAPDWRLVGRQDGLDVWETEFTARQPGPILLYVNDAQIAGLRSLLYRNNTGWAEVQVETLSWASPPEEAASGGADPLR